MANLQTAQRTGFPFQARMGVALAWALQAHEHYPPSLPPSLPLTPSADSPCTNVRLCLTPTLHGLHSTLDTCCCRCRRRCCCCCCCCYRETTRRKMAMFALRPPPPLLPNRLEQRPPRPPGSLLYLSGEGRGGISVMLAASSFDTCSSSLIRTWT
ncbi:hypothetical protein LZ32DRAFT_56916 [Colletotrichum eremochloae]|nr:hypothetical protein LZ32DRAFT_56916 [Colletotrichum eremochloae]